MEQIEKQHCPLCNTKNLIIAETDYDIPSFGKCFLMSMSPGPSSIGFNSIVDCVLRRFKSIIEQERDNTEDDSAKKTAKNLLKKFWKIELGELPVKIIIEDPSGNSTIISDK